MCIYIYTHVCIYIYMYIRDIMECITNSVILAVSKNEDIITNKHGAAVPLQGIPQDHSNRTGGSGSY